MKVAVVALNDFPDAVFVTLELANAYKRSRPKRAETGAHLYYSVYLYEVQDAVDFEGCQPQDEKGEIAKSQAPVVEGGEQGPQG